MKRFIILVCLLSMFLAYGCASGRNTIYNDFYDEIISPGKPDWYFLESMLNLDGESLDYLTPEEQ